MPTCHQALGVLPAERPACGYWPVDFGEAAKLTLVEGASFGPEVPIDFSTAAVEKMRRRWPEEEDDDCLYPDVD